MSKATGAPVVLNQLVRYEPVVRLVQPLSGGRLLDVGSGSWGMSRWLTPRWSVVAVDRTFDDYGGASGPQRRDARPLFADVTALPFNDRDFDVVVALDLLEHVPPDRRGRAVDELCRVTGRRLIVAGPTDGAAYEADRRLFDVYDRRGQGVVRWLVEHVEYGLPNRASLADSLGRHGRVMTFGNENVRAHERMMLAETRPILARLESTTARLLAGAAREGAPAGLRSRLLRLIRGLDREPIYRSIVVLDVAREARHPAPSGGFGR